LSALRLAGLVVLYLLMACGPGEDKSTAKRQDPFLAPPNLGGLQVVDHGAFKLSLLPHGELELDPFAIAKESGKQLSCSTPSTFFFTWQSDPPAQLTFAAPASERVVTLGSGASGESASPGCRVVRVTNEGDARAGADLHYVIALGTPFGF
jgi:hypothetical protein